MVYASCKSCKHQTAKRLTSEDSTAFYRGCKKDQPVPTAQRAARAAVCRSRACVRPVAQPIVVKRVVAGRFVALANWRGWERIRK